MRTILSKSGHSAPLTPVVAQAINTQLFAVQPFVRPLELSGVALTLKHIHVDRGVYAVGTVGCPHCHREIQIEYVLSGRFLFTASTTQCRLAPGQGNVIFPDVRHAWRCEAAGAMLGILLEAVGPRHEQFLRTRPTANSRLMPVFRSPDIALWTRQLFDLLAVDLEPWHSELTAGILEIWLRAALLEALTLDAWLSHAQAVGNQADAHGRHVCERALDFMAANYGQPMHLHDIAGQVGVSGRHLNRLFRCHVGQSVNEHLAALRLAKARALLREQPALSIKETAYASGFFSPAYFTHCFKKAYRCLPRERQTG